MVAREVVVKHSLIFKNKWPLSPSYFAQKLCFFYSVYRMHHNTGANPWIANATWRTPCVTHIGGLYGGVVVCVTANVHFFKFTMAITCKRTASRASMVPVTEPFFAAHVPGIAKVFSRLRTWSGKIYNRWHTIYLLWIHRLPKLFNCARRLRPAP